MFLKEKYVSVYFRYFWYTSIPTTTCDEPIVLGTI